MASDGSERVAVPCSVCGGSQTRPFAVARYTRLVENFQVVRCAGCGFVYVSPRLARGEVEDDYVSRPPVAEAEARRQVTAQARRHRFALSEIELRAEPGAAGETRLRILEVGAGWGGFLDEARKRGHAVQGVDISRARVDFCRNALGIDVRLGDAFLPALGEGAFDVVFCAHTLEHLFDPRSALERIRALLRPGGLSCVVVPNLRFMGGRRRRGRMIDDPRHLSHFSVATLARILAATGFEVGEVSAGFALFGAWARLLRDEAVLHRASAATARWTRPFGRGGEVTAWARRPGSDA